MLAPTQRMGCPLLPDTVARVFQATKRATLIRRQRSRGKEDSKTLWVTERTFALRTHAADFCNTISTNANCRLALKLSAYGGRPEVIGAQSD